MNKEFISAIEMLEQEKGIDKEVIFEAVESALVTAYRKNYADNPNVDVNAYIDKETGEISVYVSLEVVDEVLDDTLQIALEDAKEIDPDYEVGDLVSFVVTPNEFGRIAAQSVKQTVVQKIREAEKKLIVDRFEDKKGTVLLGKVVRISRGNIVVDIGGAEGVIPAREQVQGERFAVGDKIKVYLSDVKSDDKGAHIRLSRSHPDLVRKLFEMEVPEIEEGIIEIKSIAREAGSRTKIAVYTESEDIDPLGACVGPRGNRVQNIVDELYNEKIDIIIWDDDPFMLISNVLSPAKVETVEIDEEERSARVVVPDYQLSLAIGKSGQNVRLAARLCGWKIDIKSHTQDEEERNGQCQEEEIVTL
ncbi:MAG: transcription termination factor NusA [Eubacteriales bacterium]|nr:transcription termination factor NusA [Eubacteriales bacterium]MDY3332261.1 transcription termination factor NusA [Gallibacter sp.]